MAATMERLEEYRQYNNQFCKRLMDFLFIMFTAQGNLLLGENSGLVTSSEKGGLVILEHKPIELYLGRYVGLILYMKEMDESKYSKVCGVSSCPNAVRSCPLIMLCRRTSLQQVTYTPSKSRRSSQRTASSSGKLRKKNLSKVSRISQNRRIF